MGKKKAKQFVALANPERVLADQERRRSSAASKHRNKTKYRRVRKHRKGELDV